MANFTYLDEEQPTASGFTYLDGEPPRSAIGEIANQFKAGVVSDLPKMAGQALQYASDPGRPVYEQGKGLAAWATKQGERPDLQPQEDQHNIVTNALASGARMIPQSVVPAGLVGAGLAFAPIGAPAALAGSAILGSIPAAMSQGQETLDKGITAGLSRDEAIKAARINAAIEGGGETAGTYFGGKLFGIGAKAVGKVAGSGAEGGAGRVLQEIANPKTFKPWLKQIPETALIETGTEIGQNAGEAAVENAYGIDAKTPYEAGKEAIAPTLGMTALLAPFGLAGFAHNAHVSRQRAAALASPDTPQPLRAKISDDYYAELQKVDPATANNFKANADRDIVAGNPMVLDASLFAPAQASPLTTAAAVGIRSGAVAQSAAVQAMAAHDSLASSDQSNTAQPMATTPIVEPTAATPAVGALQNTPAAPDIVPVTPTAQTFHAEPAGVLVYPPQGQQQNGNQAEVTQPAAPGRATPAAAVSAGITPSQGPTYQGMTAEEMATVASRHGNDYDAALEKIKANPGRWIATVQKWLDAEAVEKKSDAKQRRSAAWTPNEAQSKVIGLISDTQTFSKSADAPMFPHNAASTRALISRGVLDRREVGDSVEYSLRPIASAKTNQDMVDESKAKQVAPTVASQSPVAPGQSPVKKGIDLSTRTDAQIGALAKHKSPKVLALAAAEIERREQKGGSVGDYYKTLRESTPEQQDALRKALKLKPSANIVTIADRLDGLPASERTPIFDSVFRPAPSAPKEMSAVNVGDTLASNNPESPDSSPIVAHETAPDAPQAPLSSADAPQAQAEMGLRDMAQRQVNAADKFIESVVEQFGLSKDDATKAWNYYLKNKLVSVDSVGGQYNLKDGRLWNGDSMREAAKQDAPADRKADLETRKAELLARRKRLDSAATKLSVRGEHLAETLPAKNAAITSFGERLNAAKPDTAGAAEKVGDAAGRLTDAAGKTVAERRAALESARGRLDAARTANEEKSAKQPAERNDARLAKVFKARREGVAAFQNSESGALPSSYSGATEEIKNAWWQGWKSAQDAAQVLAGAESRAAESNRLAAENSPATTEKPHYDEASPPTDTRHDSSHARPETAVDQPLAQGQRTGRSYTPARGAQTARYRPGRADDRGLRNAGRRADGAPVESQAVGDGSGLAAVHDGSDGDLAGRVQRVSADFRPGLGALTREGSWFDAAKRNIDLIEMAIQIDKEKRNATTEEQALLAKYVGFGASEIRNALFPLPGEYAKRQEPNRLIWPNMVRDARWKPLAERIDALPREWQQSILQSTQYAHYTSEGIIRSIWSAIQRLGFTGGNIFEPGTGIGSFSMLMPDGIHATSRFTGVEFDAPTALIARLLSPDQQIQHDDFIKRKFPKNYFDVNVGNPPFSQTRILGDAEYAKNGFMLHDFFFAKGIDLVRAGGLQVFVTSKGTMDKKTDRARKFLADRADLIGAIRLPSTAFEGNAGTSVVTDVIFLKKRAPGEAPGGMAWGGIKTVDTKDGPVEVNEYFADHPEMILGQQRISGNMDDMGRRVNSNGRGGEKYTVVSYDSTPAELDAKFAQAVERLPENIYSPLSQSDEAVKAETQKVDFDPTVKREGVIYLAKDGAIMRVASGVGVPLDGSVKLSEKDRAWIKGYIGVRDLVQAARLAQVTDGNWKAGLRALNKAYDAFRAEHGPIRDFRTQIRKSTDEEGNVVETESRIFKNKRLYREDYDASLLTSLEDITESGEIVKAPFLLGRTIGKPVAVEVKSIGDALAVSLDSIGSLDLADVGRRMKLGKEETIEALGSQIYKTPAGDWQLSDEYLSGDVVTKLEEAEHLARSNPEYRRNVEALKEVQPEKLGPSQISAKIGASWIPEAHVNEFAKEIGAGQVTFDIKTETWQVDGGNRRTERKAGAEYGTAARSASELLEASLNSRSIKVTAVVDKKTVTDVAATTAANEMAKKIKDKFKRWIWTDSDRASELVEAYNKRFNNIAPRKFDGSHLSLPGVSLRFKLHPHQLRSIWRQIQTGDTYLAHAVGAGKTIEMIAGAMEQKRLGLIKKPMFVVPNHMLEQFSNEFMELYPLANIMVADDENFSAERRKAFVASATLNNPDAIILTHSAFKRIGVTEESVDPIRNEILTDLEIELDELAKDQGTRVRRSQLEQQIEAVKQRFDAIIGASGKDSTIKFEDIGADFIYADEAHAFRKLDFHTAQSIKGIDPNGSQAAMDMYVKTRILERARPGRSFVFASGTPVTNTMGELFTIMRFFAPKEMELAGISTFDSWARQFGEVEPALEPNAAGKYELIERFAKFDNVPELMSRVRQFMDVLTSEGLGALVKRPDLAGGKPNLVIVDSTPALDEYMKGELSRRIETSKQWKPSPGQPSNPDPIVAIITDGRFAAIDPRFFGAALEGESIITTMASKIAEKYHATKGNIYLNKHTGKPEPIKGSTQIVFYNLGFGEQSQKSRGFNSRAAFTKLLTDGGIPRAEIAWFDDANTDAKKEAIFKDMRSGKLKVLIGSAKKMGTGVNVQNRLIALHYQDPPWFPADVEQPHGRIIRQGNLNPEVSIDWYTTKGTYQSTMWQMVGRKQRFIDQAFTGDKSLRNMDDMGEASLFEQAAAVASGDPRALQLAGLRQDVERFERLQAAHAGEQISIRSALRQAEWNASSAIKRISQLSKAFKAIGEQYFQFERGTVGGRIYNKVGEFGQALKDAFNLAAKDRLMDMAGGDSVHLASIGDAIKVTMEAQIDKNKMTGAFLMNVEFGGSQFHITTSSALGTEADATGLARKVFNQINGVDRLLRERKADLTTNEADIIRLKKKRGAPFEYQQEMAEKYGELKRLEEELQSEGEKIAKPEQQAAPKWKEDVRNQRMAPVDGLLYNVATEPQTTTSVRKELADMLGAGRLARLERMGLVKIHQSIFDMPLGGQKYLDAWGWFDGKTMHLVAGNMEAGQAPGVFAHEAWHRMLYSLKMDASPLFKQIMDRLADIERRGGAVTWFKEANAAIPEEDRQSDEMRLNELAAYAIQQYEERPASLPAAVRKWVLDLVSSVRAFFMAKLGWVQADLAPSDLAALTRRYLNGLTRSSESGATMAGPIYSRRAQAAEPSPADKAIYGMAAEGKSAQEILSFIAKASRRPFNRYLANALKNLGASSSVTLDSQGGWQFGNSSQAQKYAAAYNPKTDTVALFTAREAERHALHELTHAATLKAIAAGGPASIQMRGLYLHLKRNGSLSGQYGMSNLDEFVAEAFSNPKFQAALKEIPAPKGSGLQSAWQWFVRAVARVLGIKTAAMETALDRALTLGGGLMRENAALAGRTESTRFSQQSEIPDTITIDGVERPTTNSNGKPIAQDEAGTRRFYEWFGDSKAVDSQGRPLVVYHGSDQEITEFEPGRRDPGVWFTSRRETAAGYAKGDSPQMHEVYLRAENPFVADFSGWNGGGDVVLDGEEFDSNVGIVKYARKAGHDGVNFTIGNFSEDDNTWVVFRPEQIKSATGNNNQFSPDNPDIRYNLDSSDDTAEDVPTWWGEPSDNPYAKGMTNGEVIQDALDRHFAKGALEKQGNKYVFYHATPIKTLKSISYLRDGSLLETDKESATHHARNNRGISARSIAVLKVLVDPWQLYPPSGPWFSLRGEFPIGQSKDQASDDIRFNIATDWIKNPSVTDFVANAMRSDKSTSIITPFNTQYHKAEKWAAEGKPLFKRVFELGQKFLSDTSRFAIMAQHQAPTLFHELRSVGDVATALKAARSIGDLTGAKHKADIAAIANPLYKGTLYGGGSPTSGVIFSDAKLRADYKLTDRQIKLYHEALAAVNTSLDEMAKSVIAKHAKHNGVSFDSDLSINDMADDVIQRLDDAKADMEMLLDHSTQERIDGEIADLREMDMDEQAEKLKREFSRSQKDAAAGVDRIDKTIADVRGIVAKNKTLQEHGYFPLMRFGKHTVTARDATGKVTYFGMFEGMPLVPRSGQYQANQVAAAVRAEHPEWTVTTGIHNTEQYKLYQGLNLEAIQLFADHMDAETLEPYQEFLRQATGDRSVLKRLIHRQGTPGFDRDVRRTLSQFIVSNARHTSSSYHMGDMLKAAEQANKDGGDIGAEAVKLYEYVAKPQEELHNLRGFLFFNFLGGSIASAMVNATQVPMMTFPYLTRYENAAALGKRLVLAAHLAIGNPENVQGALGEALRQAEMDGVTAPQEIHQLTATAANNIFSGSRGVNAALRLWGAPFAMAESFNRRTTFIAAYQIAEQMTPKQLAETGTKSAFEFAEQAVKDTQGIYNKGNRMNAGRGAVGATLMTFKQYSIMYLELLKRMPRKQQLIMLGMLTLASGAGGWPFEEDVEDLIDTLGQWLGYGTNSKKWLRNKISSATSPQVADALMNGALSQMGIDLHSRMGMQNLIPATGILKQSSVDKGRDTAEFFGPAASVLQNAATALQELATGHADRAALAMAPGAVQNLVKGAKMASTGYAEDAKGRRTVPVNEVESAAKAIGFNPKSVADFGTIKRDVAQDQRMVQVKREEFTSAMADAILSGDNEERLQAMADLRQWNQDNPSLLVVINPSSIMQRVRAAKMEGADRFLKTVSRPMRSAAREELRP